MIQATLKPVIAVAIALWLVGPASAQKNEQSVINDYFSIWTDGDGLKTLSHLASCVAERHPEGARAFVLNTTDATALQADQERLIEAKCVKKYWLKNSHTSVVSDTYRPMLAEALLVQNYTPDTLPRVSDVVGSNDRPTLPDVPLADVHPYYKNLFLISGAAMDLAEASECIARARPTDVLRLSDLALNSVDERAALDRLNEYAPECGVDRLPYSFPSFLRRGTLMAELYALVNRAGAAAPRGTN